jgi:dipeptidyl aminopeptidase/acylaminoacyl peptidase
MKFLRKTWKGWLIVLVLLPVVIWAGWPAWRAIQVIANRANRGTPGKPSDLPLQDVRFDATDGTHLAGWLLMASPQKPTIILSHGLKSSRAQTLPWARFLYQAGYNVLLYDSRGCGESEGWGVGLGGREAEDVLGAVRYLKQRADLSNKQIGALGLSLGGGASLLAAAQEPAIQAVVADSSWVDATKLVDYEDNFHGLPLLPYEPALVDQIVGAHLAETRPIAAVSKIAPRGVLLIHSADDEDPTTPLSGSQQLYQAAGEPKELWIVPHGGHTGALAAYPDEYKQRVLAFLATHLLQKKQAAA